MSGGGGGGDTTSTNVNYSPEEAARRTQVMDEAQRIYDSTKGQMSSSAYPGSTVAPLSSETKLAQNVALNNASQAQGALNSMSSGINYGLNGAMDVENNPYLAKAAQSALRVNNQNFSDAGGTLSQIRTGAEQAGQYGGSRQGIAEGLALSRLNQTNADTVNQMYSDAYDTGQQTFSKTLNAVPSLVESYQTPSTMVSAVGAQNENYHQQLNDYDAKSKLWNLKSQWTPLQNYAQIVFGGASPGSTTTTSGQTRSGLNAATQAAGTGLTAYSLAQQLSNL